MYKYNNDRNNFLTTKEDYDLFGQLPFETKVTLYTEFLFKNFLWKFRRLLSFKKDNIKDYNIRKVLERINNNRKMAQKEKHGIEILQN